MFDFLPQLRPSSAPGLLLLLLYREYQRSGPGHLSRQSCVNVGIESWQREDPVLGAGRGSMPGGGVAV